MALVICTPCKDKRHCECPGPLWCNCQHLDMLVPVEPALGWLNDLRGPF